MWLRILVQVCVQTIHYLRCNFFSARVCICDDLCLSDQGKCYLVNPKLANSKIWCNADMTFSKKKSVFEKIINQFWKKKGQTSFRSGKLFCKFQDFFKNSRPYTNPGWLCNVNLFHSCLKTLPQEWPKVRYWLFTIYVGKPESNLLFEKSVPVTKKWLQRPETSIKDGWKKLEHKFPFEMLILYQKTGLPFQMFQCSRKFSTKTNKKLYSIGFQVDTLEFLWMINSHCLCLLLSCIISNLTVSYLNVNFTVWFYHMGRSVVLCSPGNLFPQHLHTTLVGSQHNGRPSFLFSLLYKKVTLPGLKPGGWTLV